MWTYGEFYYWIEEFFCKHFTMFFFPPKTNCRFSVYINNTGNIKVVPRSLGITAKNDTKYSTFTDSSFLPYKIFRTFRKNEESGVFFQMNLMNLSTYLFTVFECSYVAIQWFNQLLEILNRIKENSRAHLTFDSHFIFRI